MNREFLKSLADIPSLDIPAFIQAMEASPATAIKLNRRKCLDPTVAGFTGTQPVAWCESGFCLSERPVFTLNPLLHAGVFYVQDPSSMVYETIASSLVKRGMLDSDCTVLDLCAAPGGKTTSIINALGDGAFVVANEAMPKRAGALRENLVKWGFPNIMATNSPVGAFPAAGEGFDLVAVDAPCSGEGMMRKEPEARRQWSRTLTRQCAGLQREITGEAVRCLRPGGILIYSTCTFNTLENEGNAQWIAATLGLEPIDMAFPAEWGIGREVTGDVPSLRFMPHLTRGEGLYVAVFRKPGGGIPVNREKLLERLRANPKTILDGIPQTTAKGKVIHPASESVLATDFRRGVIPETDVDTDTALHYLRHEAIRLPEDVPHGFTVITYKGFPLGLAKNIGQRANNLYPAAWKIRMNLTEPNG